MYSVVKHRTMNVLVQEKQCPWALLWGEAQIRAGFTHSSFVFPQLSLPPTFLPLIRRGVPETRRWHLHYSQQIPRWAVGPAILLSPLFLPLFLQPCSSLHLGHSLLLSLPSVVPPTHSPSSPPEPVMVTVSFPVSTRFSIISVPNSSISLSFGGTECGISCYFRQWWRSRTWPCPSS